MHSHQSHVMKQTSLLAYKDIQQDLTALSQKEKVFTIISLYIDGLTRQEVANYGNLTINAVCGRVKKLLEEGRIYEAGERENRITGKRNMILHAMG